MRWRGVPVVLLIAMVLIIIGGIFHIVGIATPNWHENILTTSAFKNKVIGHDGLWVQCTQSIVDVFDCAGHNNIRGYVVATRAMVILGLLMGAVCMIIVGLWVFLEIKKHQTLLMIGTIATGFLSALFAFIGIIIYAVETNRRKDQLQGSFLEYQLSWSFALCTVSACIAMVAVVLLGLGSRMMME